MSNISRTWLIKGTQRLHQHSEHQDVHWETVCLSRGSLFPCISPWSWTRKLSFLFILFFYLSHLKRPHSSCFQGKTEMNWKTDSSNQSLRDEKQISMRACVWRDRGRHGTRGWKQAGLVSKAEKRGQLLLIVGVLEVAVGLKERKQEQSCTTPDFSWMCLITYSWDFFSNNEWYFFFAILSIKSIAKGYIHKHFLGTLPKQVIIALWYSKGERFHLTVLHFMRSGWKSFSTYFLPLIFSATFQINKIEWWCLTTFLQFVSRDLLGMTSFSIGES